MAHISPAPAADSATAPAVDARFTTPRSDVLVSIVLPTKNGSRFLADSIRSCLTQSYDHIELIIVDDGSTDTTSDIIRAFAIEDQRIRVLRHAASKGLPAALNQGFRNSQGELLTWTSDDNLYGVHALRRMVEVLAAEPTADMVYTAYSTIDEQGTVLAQQRALHPSLLLTQNIIGACFMYRRSVLSTVGEYTESLFLAEDYDYWLRLSRHSRIVPYDVDLYSYRIHSASLTARRRPGILRASDLALAANLRSLHWASSVRRVYSFLHIVFRAIRAMDIALAYRCVLAALLGRPTT